MIHHVWHVHEEQHPCGANKQKWDEHDMGSLLLLAAKVWSFAHLLLGLSSHNKVVLWPGCVGGFRNNIHKKNVQWVRFIAKRKQCCWNLSVGVALKVWFSHVQYMKRTRDEHVLRFKSCEISIYWWIWMLLFLLKQTWIGIDYFPLNFFATFGSLWDFRLL